MIGLIPINQAYAKLLKVEAEKWVGVQLASEKSFYMSLAFALAEPAL